MTLEERKIALTTLQRRIFACRLCQEKGYIAVAEPNMSGRATDRMMVIGQAPGQRSIANKKPFGGPGGRMLDQWLQQAGFPPGYLHQQTYLTSLTHCFPGKSPRGSGDRRPSAAEMALCRPFLEAEMRLVQPKVILLVGSMAIEVFCGKAPLVEVIGTFREHNDTLFLPLAHPSGVSRWLQDPEHQKLHQKALAILREWRELYAL